MNWTCNTYCRRGRKEGRKERRKEGKSKQTERLQNVQEGIGQVLL